MGFDGGAIDSVYFRRYKNTDQLMSIVFKNESKQYNFAITTTGLLLYNNTDARTEWSARFVS